MEGNPVFGSALKHVLGEMFERFAFEQIRLRNSRGTKHRIPRPPTIKFK